MTAIDELTAEAMSLRADVARLTKERDEGAARCGRFEEARDGYIEAGRYDVLLFLREQAKLVPLGAEDTRRGSSVYNWHLDAIQRVEHWLGLIKDRALTPSIPGGAE